MFGTYRRPIEEDLKMYWMLLTETRKMIAKENLLPEQNAKSVKYLKGKIRELNHWKEECKIKPEDDWRCRYPDDGYGDTVYVKYKLPYHFTDEEKDEFIKEEWCHWYNPYNDGRDCTGVWFTSRIRVIDCGNETIIIHVKNCDV